MDEPPLKKQRRGPSGAVWLGVFFIIAMAAGALARLPQAAGTRVAGAIKVSYRSTGVRLLGSLKLSSDRAPVFSNDETVALFGLSGGRAPIQAVKVSSLGAFTGATPLYEAGTAAAPPAALGMPNGLVWLSPDGFFYRQADGAVSKIAAPPTGTGTPRIVTGSWGSATERLSPPPQGSTSWGSSTLTWYNWSAQQLATITLQGTVVTSLAAAGSSGKGAAVAAGTMVVREGDPSFGLAFFPVPGKLGWEYSAGKAPLRYLTFNGEGDLLAAASGQEVAEFNPLGERLWLVRVSGAAGLIFSGRNDAIVLTDRGELAAFDRRGKRVWTRTLSGQPILLAPVPGGNLLVATSAGVIGMRADGASSWVATPDAAIKRVALSPSGTRIAVVTVDDKLLLYETVSR